MQQTVIDGFRLSPQQKRLWRFIESESEPYRAQCEVRIEGQLSVEVLKRAIEQVVERHEILRTNFRRLPGMSLPLQVIEEEHQLAFQEFLLDGASESGALATVERLWNEAAQTRLEQACAVRLLASLVQLRTNDYLLLLSLPSLCSDGSGLQNLVAEISRTYAATLRDEPLVEEPVQYVDLSEWQIDLLEDESAEAGREYWRKQDLPDLQALKLPYQHQATKNAFEPQIVRTGIDAGTIAHLEAMAEREQTTPALLLLCCFLLLIHRLTNQSHLFIASAADGRNYQGLSSALGLFLRYLPLSFTVEGKLTFTELLAQVISTATEANEYQEYLTWEQTGEGKGGERETEVLPYGYDYEERVWSYSAGQVSFSIIKEYICTERFHLRLCCLRLADTLSAEFHFDTALFDAADIERLSAQFLTLLQSVLSDPSLSISDVEIISPAEREQLLVQWNDTAHDYPHHQLVHHLFESHAALTPHAPALRYEDETLSYAELNRRANRLAHHLLSCGAGPETIVALCLERSTQMVISLLGVLKAGAAYLPLDVSYPPQRLHLMLRQSGAAILLIEEQMREGMGEALAEFTGRVVYLDREEQQIASQGDENPAVTIEQDNLAYLIYTSGSTGTPKAVSVSHLNLLHSTFARLLFYPEPPSSFLLLSSFSFDSSVAGIFWTLCTGGTLLLPAQGLQREARLLVRLIAEHQVTHLLCLPSLHALMLEVAHQSELQCLHTVIVAGEACTTELVRRHFSALPECLLYNEYGPTECSVWSSVYQCQQREVAERGVVPIGRAPSNVQLYVLDERLSLVAVGVSGELYISGEGVTRGYINEGGATAERYVPHAYSEKGGERMYRTGDVVRRNGRGEVEFVGRVDGQVKVRGYRIEIGEIEAALVEQAGVEEAVVMLREGAGGGGEKRLVGYVVGKGEGWKVEELRERLRERMPEYMIPVVVVEVGEMPRMGNGKVDRQALPAPEQVQKRGQVVQPRTAVEEVLAGIWSEVLKVAEVSVEGNFFEMGGHSLLATQVMSRVREALGVEMAVRSLFSAPTVRALAAAVEEKQSAEHGLIAPALKRVSREEKIPLSFAQQRLWFADQLNKGVAFYNVSAALRLSGDLKVEALEKTFGEIIRRHEVLRTSFPSHQGQPLQLISPSVDFSLPLLDLSALDELDEEERESKARELAQQEAERPFDLSTGPLLRVQLMRLGEEEHVVVLVMHHIVSDGWSMGILIREVGELYEGYVEGEESRLGELEIQYGDYAIWQREWLSGEVLEKELEYWREQLRGAPERMELPLDRERPAMQSYRGASERVELGEEVTQGLKSLSRREGVTLFMTLLAVYKVLLHYYSKQDDIVVGADIANRNRIELEGLIGFFVNILVLRSNLSGNPTFRELMRRVRETTLGAYAHQDLPFERLVEELRPERSLSGMPLVQTIFSFQNAPQGELKLSALTFSPFGRDGGTAKRDLTLFMTEREGGIAGTWNYNSDLFNASTIKRFSNSFDLLAGRVIVQPDVSLDDLLKLLAEAEKQRLAADKKERREAKLKQFMKVVPKGVSPSRESLVRTGFLTSGETLPLVIQPAMDDVDLSEWARGQRKFIETGLIEHGAILFRGFGVNFVPEFERFALSICPELFGEYGDLPREALGGKVYGSTPYPPEQPILFHNESSHLQRWPLKIWFFCMRAAQQGGETPIVDCRKVYELLDPKIRERFARKKLMYVRNYVDGLDVSWQNFFHTNDRTAVEDYCRRASIECDWKGPNGLRTRQICPAVATHPKTGEKVFFNQLQTHHVSYLEPATRRSLLSLLVEEDLPRHVYYGDGSPIEDSVAEEIRAIYQHLSVGFSWQEGDILMLDNMLVAHSRNPYQGERKIVVAMGEMVNKQDIQDSETEK